jgi:hypothetical protein
MTIKDRKTLVDNLRSILHGGGLSKASSDAWSLSRLLKGGWVRLESLKGTRRVARHDPSPYASRVKVTKKGVRLVETS